MRQAGVSLPARVNPGMDYGCSSIGRVVVSKTIGCGFESYHPCKNII